MANKAPSRYRFLAGSAATAAVLPTAPRTAAKDHISAPPDFGTALLCKKQEEKR